MLRDYTCALAEVLEYFQEFRSFGADAKEKI